MSRITFMDDDYEVYGTQEVTENECGRESRHTEFLIFYHGSWVWLNEERVKPCEEKKQETDKVGVRDKNRRDWEINQVKELGNEIGFGNMMCLASALWSNNLEEKYSTTSGAFIPVLYQDIHPASKGDYLNSTLVMRERVKKYQGG